MIRQRFSSGRLSRIAAWALATVTAMAAIVNNQMAAAEEQAVGTPDPATNDRSATVKATVPGPVPEGLLILRYQPAPTPPLPTIVRRVIVEERVASTPGSAPTRSQAATPTAPTASAAVPTPPPPLPAPLPAPPPVQSSGS